MATLLTPTHAFAEVSDKVLSIPEVWLWSGLGAVVAFAASRYRLWAGLLVSPVAALVSVAAIATVITAPALVARAATLARLPARDAATPIATIAARGLATLVALTFSPRTIAVALPLTLRLRLRLPAISSRFIVTLAASFGVALELGDEGVVITETAFGIFAGVRRGHRLLLALIGGGCGLWFSGHGRRT